MRTYIGMTIYSMGLIINFIGSLVIICLFFGGIFIALYDNVIVGLAMLGSSWLANLALRLLIAAFNVIAIKVGEG